jgi:hypothetical protein
MTAIQTLGALCRAVGTSTMRENLEMIPSALKSGRVARFGESRVVGLVQSLGAGIFQGMGRRRTGETGV